MQLFDSSMSILIELNDHQSLGGSSGNHHYPNLQRNTPFGGNPLNILKLIRQALFFRRLRLLRFFMATIVALSILYFLAFKIHPTVTRTEQTNDKFHKDLSGGYQQGFNNRLQDKQNDNLHDLSTNLQMAHAGPNPGEKRLFATDQNLVLVGQSTYPNNLTYSLTIRDFAQMKNINVMQVRIREAMKHSWDNYRRYAWGFDMLKPRSKEPDHWFNLGLTIVDAADTLIMMGMDHETNLALDWIEHELKFDSTNENSNCFELTIRILGGILSAYHLTAREKLKQQSINMGKILLHCYDTASKIIPNSDINLSTHHSHPPQWNPHSSLSEVASLQLEFRYLTQISGDPVYEQTTFQTSVHLHNLTSHRKYKLLPMYINPNNGQLEDSIITLGARADSYYEYLLKQYLQTGIMWLQDDYLDCVDEIGSRLIRHTNGADNYTYVAEIQVYRTANDTEEVKYYNKMDHLVCFLPGTLALGYYHFSPLASEYRLKHNLETPTQKLNSRYNDHLNMAQALARTCYHMYSNMGTGLSPEIATFVHSQSDDPLVQNQPELQVQSTSAHNILRPEFVESLFYLYHITGLPMYRNQATQVFESFQKYSRISSGYSPVSDVREKPLTNGDLDELLHKQAPDRMESFWMSETLKYLYLVFCDDRHIVATLLNNYVFNTEAHMLPIV